MAALRGFDPAVHRPGAGTALFAYTYSTRLRRLNDILLAAFVLLALFAIPYEVATRQPYRFSGAVNALVVILIFVWGANLIITIPTRDDLRPLRIASAVFAIAVANEHWRWIPRPDGINLEPIGFLVFMATIVYDLLRRAIRDQTRLASVNSELATARAMQQAVIPDRAPAVTGLDVASVYRPSALVGGDFFDYVPDGDGRLGIFIADVAGHGVPAALVASMLKIALAAESAADTPAAILDRLNRLFVGRLHRQFFTAALARIDVAHSTMTIASGGHPPVVVLGAAETIAREVAAGGFVLGRLSDASFGQSVVPFAPGSVAVMYTDGIVEAISRSGEIWGYDRLARCLEANRSIPAAEIASAIIADVQKWTNGSKAEGDDLTLVVVKAM